MTRFVVAGEGLVDLLEDDDGRLRPVAGGSPLNVAGGLRRLGIPAAWLGRLSTDPFGQRLAARLRADDVDLSMVQHTDAPTSLALVHLVDGHPAYSFWLDATTNSSWDGALPALRAGDVLHVGFGALRADDAGFAATLVELVRREAAHRPVTLDPNVRPVEAERQAGLRAAVEDLVAHARMVKVSEEDLAALGHTDAAAAAAAWAESTTVVLTRGDNGATLFGPGWSPVSVGAPPVTVIDTVGAGDATMAGLLAWLHRHDAVDRIERLGPAERADLLRFAVRCGAFTCTRAGANPPTLADLDHWLG